MKLTDAEFVYFFNGIEENEYSYYNELTLGKIFEGICENAKEKNETKMVGDAKEMSTLLIGTLVASYVSDHISGSDDHLKIFQQLWTL